MDWNKTMIMTEIILIRITDNNVYMMYIKCEMFCDVNQSFESNVKL